MPPCANEDMSALALTVAQTMRMNRGTHLHGPILGGRFVDDLDLAVNVGKLHIFTLAHQEQLEGVRGGSKDCVCPGTEPVCMEHLPVLVFPQCCDSAAVRQDREQTSHVTAELDHTAIGYPLVHSDPTGKCSVVYFVCLALQKTL